LSKPTRTIASSAVSTFVAVAVFFGEAAAQTYGPIPQFLGDSNPLGIHASIAPYGWLAGASGNIYSNRFQTSQTFSVSFGDLVKVLQFAAALGVQIDGGGWHGRVDAEYVGLSQSTGPITLLGGRTASLTSQTFFGTGTVGYSLVQSNIWEFGPYVGARGWDITNKLDIPPVASLPTQASVTNGWVDPIIGAASQYRISSLFLASLGFDVGGFDVGAQFEGQATASVDIRFTHWLLGYVGFRYLYLDYVSTRYRTQLNMYGPVLGLAFAF
jgi:hypothetical protein